MIAVLGLLSVALMFVTAARVATITLVGTGMATESASFQARSALMGVGFTTAEAEARDGVFIGAPTGHTVIHVGDTVIAYGRFDHLGDLDDRHRGIGGDRAHIEMVRDQHEILIEQDEHDPGAD